MGCQMCLAVPLKIIHIHELLATVDLHGALADVSLLLLPEEAKVGDYILVHAGFAIQKMDEEAANDALELLKVISEKNVEPNVSYS